VSCYGGLAVWSGYRALVFLRLGDHP
jgi:hypothetical protein